MLEHQCQAPQRLDSGNFLDLRCFVAPLQHSGKAYDVAPATNKPGKVPLLVCNGV